MRRVGIYISLSYISGIISYRVISIPDGVILPIFVLLLLITTTIIFLNFRRERFNQKKFNRVFTILTIIVFYLLGVCRDSSQYKEKESHSMSKITPLKSLYSAISKQIDRITYNTENQAILKAFILGEKRDLDNNIKDNFRKSGVAHTLSLSGLHVGIIWSGIYYLFYILLFWLEKKDIILYISIIIIAVYIILTGASPSIVRGGVMLSLFNISSIYNRRKDHISSLFWVAFFIAISNPKAIYSISFQLSFAAVSGILFLYPTINKSIIQIIGEEDGIIKKILKSILQLCGVSIACQITTLPICLYYFGQSSPHFLISNLVVIPTVSLCIYSSIIALIIKPLPYMGEFMVAVTNILLNFIKELVEFLA